MSYGRIMTFAKIETIIEINRVKPVTIKLIVIRRERKKICVCAY